MRWRFGTDYLRDEFDRLGAALPEPTDAYRTDLSRIGFAAGVGPGNEGRKVAREDGRVRG